RDFHVTGVQTCALPISTDGSVGPAVPALDRAPDEEHHDHTEEREPPRLQGEEVLERGVEEKRADPAADHGADDTEDQRGEPAARSEERRVGKECRGRWT